MNKKLVWLIVGLIVLIAILFAMQKKGLFGDDANTKVSMEPAEKRTIIEAVNASGKVYPEIEVKVSPDISGEIVELAVQEGDSVRKGQVLARIYADIYNTQRDQAAAVVSQQQAIVSNSTAQLAALKSSLTQAQSQYNRQKKLLDDKVISKSEFEQAENALQTAQANYNAALQSIKGNQAAVNSALANLEKASKDISRTVIVSPMSGVVSLLNVKKGERVVGNSMMAGTEMMRIADMSKIEVRVDVGENDIPKVKLGDSAIVEIDAYSNRRFKGIVTQIASSNTGAANTTTVATNDVTNYKVYIRLLPESYKDLVANDGSKKFPFRPGMSASADIQTKTHVNTLSVPVNAVTTREKGSDKARAATSSSSFDKKENEQDKDNNEMEERRSVSTEMDEVVYVLNPDNTVKRVKVQTGIQDINYIEILGGLQGGEKIITGPYSVVNKQLKEGMAVKVVDKDKLYETKKK